MACLKAAALQFPLGHPSVATILTGVRSREEWQENLRLFELEIPRDLWLELRESILVQRFPAG